jgi:hypothetical protein
MRSFLLLIGLLAGCSAAPMPRPVFIDAVAPEPSIVGMTGTAASSTFLNPKVRELRDRVNPVGARIRELKDEVNDYRKKSNIASVLTVTTGTVIAVLSDYAVAGGVISAITGGYSLYIEKQRDHDFQKEIDDCMTVMKDSNNLIDNYSDSWNITFLNYGDQTVPLDIIESFRAETNKLNSQIQGLIKKCP